MSNLRFLAAGCEAVPVSCVSIAGIYTSAVPLGQCLDASLLADRTDAMQVRFDFLRFAFVVDGADAVHRG